MPEVQEVFRMATQKVRPDPGFVERQRGQQHKRNRNRKVGAFAVGAVIATTAVVFALRVARDESQRQPADVRPSVTTPTVPDVDYTLDLSTGEMVSLPVSMIGTHDQTGEYAVHPDGRHLAYVGVAEDGNHQIFVARIGGTHVEQVTHDPTGPSYPLNPSAPAWSPDGTMVAFEGYGTEDVRNLFVVDVTSGETTQVTFEKHDVFGTQFSPDGSSLVYAGGDPGSGVRLAPIEGGKDTLLVGGGGDRGDAGNGLFSPDGSMLTYAFSEVQGAFPDGRWIANADGSDSRRLTDVFLDCAPGAWSPDSTRLACSDLMRWYGVFVVDVATGTTTKVAEGDSAVWLDERTLLVDV